MFCFAVCADTSLEVKKKYSADNIEYDSIIDEVKERLCDKLSTTEDKIILQDLFELSYKMYNPILLIYYEFKPSLFSSNMYLCICCLDEERKLVSLNIEKCRTRKLNEIFDLPDSQK